MLLFKILYAHLIFFVPLNIKEKEQKTTFFFALLPILKIGMLSKVERLHLLQMKNRWSRFVSWIRHVEICVRGIKVLRVCNTFCRKISVFLDILSQNILVFLDILPQKILVFLDILL